MIALIQRVSLGKVEIKGENVAVIDRGIVALVAVQSGDTSEIVESVVKRLLNYRIFPDKVGKMNLSLVDTNGGLILVPQFTLLADTKKGNRPSFSNNVPVEIGKKYFEELVSCAKEQFSNVQQGQFGADMQVTLINDGPVTFWLEV